MGWTIGVLGFDSRRGLGIFLFTTASRKALGPTQPPIQWVPGALTLDVKWPGRESDHSPPSSAEVEECVELYLHYPNTPSWRGAQLKAQGQIYLLLASQGDSAPWTLFVHNLTRTIREYKQWSFRYEAGYDPNWSSVKLISLIQRELIFLNETVPSKDHWPTTSLICFFILFQKSARSGLPTFFCHPRLVLT
jgi:hypothetical protein